MNSSNFSLAVSSAGPVGLAADDTSHVRHLWKKISHATCYNLDMTTVGDPFSRQLFDVSKLFHDYGLPCLRRLAAHPHLSEVGLGDTHCAVLPFLDSGFNLFHCFFEIAESLLQR